MARGEIQAGSAFVRIYAKTSELANGLVNAENRLRQFADVATIVGNVLETVQRKANELSDAINNFGRRMSLTGLAISAAGISIATALGGAIAQFATFGESIAKMADRMGIGVQALAELSYAAEVAGTSISELELGIRQMQSQIADKGLGLRGLPPEQQLEILADRFTQLATAEERTAFAQEMFGRSGTRMLPLLAGGAAGIRQLREEAVRFGRSISEQDARNAERLKDAWQSLVRAVRGVSVAIGSVFAESLTKILTSAAEIVGTFGKWIRENEMAAKAIAGVAAAMIAVGAAVTVVGAGISVLIKTTATLLSISMALVLAYKLLNWGLKAIGITGAVISFVLKGVNALLVLLGFSGTLSISSITASLWSAVVASGALSASLSAVGVVLYTVFWPLTVALAVIIASMATIAAILAGVTTAAVIAGIAFWKLADPLKAIMPLIRSIGRTISTVFGSLMQGEFEAAANALVDGIRDATVLAMNAMFEMIRTAMQRLPAFIEGILMGAAGLDAAMRRVVTKLVKTMLPVAIASANLMVSLFGDVFDQLPAMAAHAAGRMVREFVKNFLDFQNWLTKSMAEMFLAIGEMAAGFGKSLVKGMMTGDFLGADEKFAAIIMRSAKANALAAAALLSGLAGAEGAEFKLSPETLKAQKALMAMLGSSTGGGAGGSQSRSQSQSDAMNSAFVTYSATALSNVGGAGGISGRMLRIAEGSDKKLGRIVEYVFEGAKSSKRLADGMRMK